MLPQYFLDWAIRAVSIFNTITLLWLGLTILLNAERRRWGTWVAAGGLLLGGIFFAAHSAVVGLAFGALYTQISFWWHLIWLPFIFSSYLWYLVIIWYTGMLRTGRHSAWLWIVSLLGLLALGLLLFAPSYKELTHQPPASIFSVEGVPAIMLIYPLYSVLCIVLSLSALRRPAGSDRFMGALAQQVVGMTAYTMFDSDWYVEAGLYRTLAASLLQRRPFNAGFGGRIIGAAPYVRLAYTRTIPGGDFEVGGYLFNVRQGQVGSATNGVTAIPLAGPSNNYDDYGLDASYQYLGNGKNIVTAQALYVTERQSLYGIYDSGGSSNLRNTVNSLNLNSSYWYKNTYGITLSGFRNDGTADPILYANRTGSPLTQGYMLELDLNPFGKYDSFDRPWVNFRFGLQYTYYTLFDGAATNYDGAGTNASANNTVYAYVWTAF